MKTDTLSFLAALSTLIASACGGDVGVELGRVGQGAAGSAMVPDGGTGGLAPVPDSGTGGTTSGERRPDAAGGSGGTAGSGGSADGTAGNAGTGSGGAAGTGGAAPTLCEQILIDNSAPGAPAYPSIYLPLPDGLANAQQQVAAFLAHYGIPADKFSIELDEMTATPSFSTHLVGDPQVPLLQPPGKIENGTFETAARAFVSQWDGLFRSNGVPLVKSTDSDSSGDCDEWGICRISLVEDYCGFGVMSYGGPDLGTLLVQASQDTSLISRVLDTLVPLIPIYSKPVFSPEQVAASLLGKTYVICGFQSCDPHPITAETQLDATLQVLVGRPEGKDYLEYRLAYRVLVNEAIYMYVLDAIEGSILYERPLIIG